MNRKGNTSYNVREDAVHLLYDILYQGAYSTDRLVLLSPIYEERDRRYIRHLIYGVLEQKFRLEAVLSNYITKKVKNKKIHSLLLLGIYEQLFLTKIPTYATLSEYVEIAKKIDYRQHTFVNGVFRSLHRTIDHDGREEIIHRLAQSKNIEVRWNMPAFIVSLFFEQYDKEEAKKIITSLNHEAAFTARIHNNEAFHLFLEKESYHFDELRGHVEDAVQLSAFSFNTIEQLLEEGTIYIQDEGSIEVVNFLNPEKNDIILDMCSAPGGKTTHLAQKCLHVYAYELYPHRMEKVKSLAQRLALSNITCRCEDTRYLSKTEEQKYTKILLDAPCSGLGVLKRKPEIRFSMTEDKLQEIYTVQQELLEAAYRMMDMETELVYSTCTLNIFENERQIQSFCERHPNIRCLEEKKIYPYQYNSDGFYMAKLKKVSE